jgi:hypothetical protein
MWDFVAMYAWVIAGNSPRTAHIRDCLRLVCEMLCLQTVKTRCSKQRLSIPFAICHGCQGAFAPAKFDFHYPSSLGRYCPSFSEPQGLIPLAGGCLEVKK